MKFHRKTFLSVLAVCLLGFSFATQVKAQEKSQAKTDGALKTEPVQFPAGKDTVGAFLTEPSGTGRHPAVIVIHAWWGLNDWIKDQAQKLAGEGFVALAVDLYGGRVATDATGALDLRMGLKDDVAIRDVQAAYEYLMTRNDVDRDHIGVIGWDMGAAYALRLAMTQPRLAACVVNYGALPTDPNDIQVIFAPVLGNFAGRDRGVLPSDVQSFEKTLKNLSRRVDIKIYDDAKHGFENPNDPDNYQPDAAADAWARSIAFLKKSLK
jgi:carboxymethylenebutenolidase